MVISRSSHTHQENTKISRFTSPPVELMIQGMGRIHLNLKSKKQEKGPRSTHIFLTILSRASCCSWFRQSPAAASAADGSPWAGLQLFPSIGGDRKAQRARRKQTAGDLSGGSGERGGDKASADKIGGTTKGAASEGEGDMKRKVGGALKSWKIPFPPRHNRLPNLPSTCSNLRRGSVSVGALPN